MEAELILHGGREQDSQANVKGLVNINFAFPKIIFTFDPTNQIFLPLKGVWFLLRRVKRLGSVKPWQPILNIRKTVPKPNPGKTGDDKNLTLKQ
jgi:hypothetical protein